MYDLQLQHLQAFDGPSTSAEACGHLHHNARIHLRRAGSMFNRLCLQNRLSRMRAWLAGQPANLLDLEHAAPAVTVTGRYYEGLQSVPIQQICGSEGRSRDFDRAFRPQREHMRARWVNVAVARQAGTPMPPVALVRIGDRYFVRDGHHRISVARALGEEFIEAEVAVWVVRDAPVEQCQPATSATPSVFALTCDAQA